MSKKINFLRLIPILTVALSYVVGFYFYPLMPERLATHWNAVGVPNGYSGKGFAIFFVPTLMLAVFALYIVLSKIDPMKKNFEKIADRFFRFMDFIFIFFFYLYVLTLAWNLGYRFDMLKFLAPAFGIMIYAIGAALPNLERNWTFGIRTPWTLSDDEVWRKTHKLGGKLFKICGLLSLIGVVSHWGFWLFFWGLMLSSFYLFTYSYWLFRKMK
jgi:uncharacterized membrane protein